MGIIILSTSQGLLTDREARLHGIGVKFSAPSGRENSTRSVFVGEVQLYRRRHPWLAIFGPSVLDRYLGPSRIGLIKGCTSDSRSATFGHIKA
jgi:hypothetical protein